MVDSMTIGVIIGLIIGVIFMIIMYILISLERDKYALKEKQIIENLAKLLEKKNYRRKE
jgi:hypothetical protein